MNVYPEPIGGLPVDTGSPRSRPVIGSSAQRSEIFWTARELAGSRIYIDDNVATVRLPRCTVRGASAQARRYLVSIKRQRIHMPSLRGGQTTDLVTSISLEINPVCCCGLAVNGGGSLRRPMVGSTRQRSQIHWCCCMAACTRPHIGINITRVVVTPRCWVGSNCTRRSRIRPRLRYPIYTPRLRVCIRSAHSPRLPNVHPETRWGFTVYTRSTRCTPVVRSSANGCEVLWCLCETTRRSINIRHNVTIVSLPVRCGSGAIHW